jgi:predicted Zn-dependent protease
MAKVVRLGFAWRILWWILAAAACVVAAFCLLCKTNWGDVNAGHGSARSETRPSQPSPKSDALSAVRHKDDSDGALAPVPSVVLPRDTEPVLHAKAGEQRSNKIAPPPDRQVAVKAEIDALKEEAIKVAQTLIDDFPTESDSFGVMGMLYDRCNQEAKAVEYWQKALERNPNRSDLYFTMATIALRKGDYEKAAQFCRIGISKFPQMPEFHYQLAEALIGLGRAEESESELLVAIRQAPDNGEYCRLLGKAYSLLNDYQRAKASYESAVKLKPQSAAAHYGLALACSELGLQDQSEREMEQYQKLLKEHTQVPRSQTDAQYDTWRYRRNLAMTCCDAAAIYLSKGMSEKAETLLRRGAEADPEHIGCQVQLAQVLFNTNRFSESAAVLQRLVECEPRNAILQLRLATAYARLDRFDEARASARKSMQLAPGNAECRRFLEQLEGKR